MLSFIEKIKQWMYLLGKTPLEIDYTISKLALQEQIDKNKKISKQIKTKDKINPKHN
jgi:hypothetical protein